MRVTRQEMETGHRRIVEGASRLLRERGVRDTSVADAMHAAGMTHGGFYRHFRTKEDLVIEALRQAFDSFASPLEHATSPGAVAAEYRKLYLSEGHRDNPGLGCPMPALGSDIARESDAVKEAFAAGFQRLIAALANAKTGSPQQRADAAMREVAMLAGAVLIARCCDPATSSAVLRACRD